ncbi:MAG: MarR family transcriptional regulator [Pseudomonadales bacterium]|nr:MarR family transcriptional regulator [Pseudomonadales bacterium]
MADYDEILIALRKITRAIDLHSKQLHKASGLTTSQLLVMQAILRLDMASPSAIAREVMLSQATISSLLDRLERNRLVRRMKGNRDRRQTLIELTTEGQEKLARSPSPIQSDFVRKYRALPDWQQHQLVASMQQVASMMNAETLDASPILTSGEIQTVSAS